jgi:hypothetical protein
LVGWLVDGKFVVLCTASTRVNGRYGWQVLI